MVVIVDYGLGNLKSVRNMLLRAGSESITSGDPGVIGSASALILPGVGHFGFAIEALRAHGLVRVLNERALEARVPVLGICLGAQLLGRSSEEGEGSGLGWVPMDTVRFDASRLNGHRVPHMGWAQTSHTASTLFADFPNAPRFYYVHSFHFRCDDPSMITCTAEHGYRFPAGIGYKNIFGVQFHPEKSHAYGQQLLKNFAGMKPGQ